MKAHFQGEIDSLNRLLRAQADRVLNLARRAADAATRADPSAAPALKTHDREVDREEVRIEEECLKILALYAPVADELRYVFAITKVNHELERVGDLATRVARLAAALAHAALAPLGADVARLARLAADAAAQAIDAFVTQNADLARTVWQQDATLDELRTTLCARIDALLERRAAPLADLLSARTLVAALERIGDHAARIVKIVLYLRHGEILRHRPPPADLPRVLFVCIHNSARSQMAEAWLRHLYGDRFEAESAGLEPGTLNPLAVEAMREVGIDIANRPTRAVFDLVKSGRLYAYVITVCDETAAERCPVFVGVTRRRHWSFADPAAFTGSHEERLAATRQVRDAIRARIEEWVRSPET